MFIYYIDPISGNDLQDGLTPETARKTYKALALCPGDTVCFKRGSFYREALKIVSGSDDYPITYSAYGKGAAPVFCGSTDVSMEADWEEILENIWFCKKEIPGDVGNFVFNEGDCTAALRWSPDQLTQQGDFWDSRFGEGEQKDGATAQKILLYSAKHPAQFYSHIECVSYKDRVLGRLCSNIIIENLHFKNSGVHALAGEGKNVIIRNCTFENIGGCVWNRGLQIRFGNGVEFWVYGENILVENCTFKNIYDSCVTHQGPGEKTIPTRNFICRNNIFDTYGMAAFEYRDKLPIDSAFTGNTCRNAGCGFAMLGEELPRKSEIWPQPMGHHIFLWRIPSPTVGGHLEIKSNVFGPAPVGAAIYSIIAPEAEAQIELDQNTYTGNPVLLNRFGGVNYSDFETYRTAVRQDAHSSVQV